MRKYCRHHCERCGISRGFHRRLIDHSLHFALTMITFGLWGLVWLWIAYVKGPSRWRCTVCGSSGRQRSQPSTDQQTRVLSANLRRRRS